MSKNKYNPKDLPKYRNPPVSEVAIGISFEPLKDFKIPHSGLFWEKIKGDFPNCEHAIPLGIEKNEGIDSKTGMPLPRLWFVNQDKDKLIQLQNGRFYFNWRRKKEDVEYPSYKKIKGAYDKYLKLFSGFVEENKLGSLKILNCELNYINQIPKGKIWGSSDDFQKIFPILDLEKFGEGFLKNPERLNWETKFDFPENRGVLIVNIKKGVRGIDSFPVLALEFVAQGLGEDKSEKSVESWFEMAHNWIVRGFADITALKIQEKVWERYQ